MSSMKFRRNIAIVIGINDYQDGVPTLKTPVNDAQTLEKILQTQHGYETYLVLNQKANRKNLIALVEKELPEKIEANDRLLFYFAGHGIALHGEDGPEGFLIPQNARLGDVSTYLSMSQVHKALLQLPCSHFLGILDCCFAGSVSWSRTRKLVPVDFGVIHRERFDRFIQDPAWQIITSAGHDQTALDAFSDALSLQDHRGQAGIHSPFAAALIDALQGEADAYPPAKPGRTAGDGVITATELYLYLRDRVEVATEDRALRQTPGIHHLKKHDKGEYIFLAPGHELNLPPAPPLDESKNPYRGLQPFEENHSELFFGRSELSKKLHDFVKTHSLTVVLGRSGSGKSSLVKAGLIPRLKQDAHGTHANWCILSPIRPRETPFQALNNALVKAKLEAIELQNPHKTLAQSVAVWAEKNPKAQLLLFIDQSEEIITLCSNETERQEFFQQILTAIDAHQERLRVVLSLRSDFEPQIRDTGLKFAPEALNRLGQAELKKFWQRGRFNVPPMTRAELREAIEKPAEARVMYFQPHDLVEKIVDEVAEMPGALPLLSFALSELYLKYLRRQWDARNRGVTIDRALTQEDYQDLGGVIQSLTQSADEEYQALVEKDPAYAQIIRHVMLRMVTLGGGELARRQVPLLELEYPLEKNDLVKEVIERFTNARLLVKGEDAEANLYVEPAHDALVRGWQRLLEWKQEKEESLILQRRLTPSAVEWESLKSKEQPSGFQAKVDPIIDELDRKLYLVETLFNKTTAQLARLWRRKQNQQERSKEKSVQFLWNASPYLDVLNENLNSSDNWFNQVEAKFVQESVLQKRRNISWRGRITLGLILTLSSLPFSLVGQRSAQIGQIRASRQFSEANLRSDQEFDALIESLQAGKTLTQPLLQLFKPDNQIQNQLQETLQKAVYQVKERTRLKGSRDNVSSVVVSFSPAGQRLATAGYDGAIRLWNLQGKNLKEWKTDPGTTISFSPNGQLLATTSGNGMVRLWNLQGQILKEWNADQDWLAPVSFSPDGQRLATAGSTGMVRLWNLQGQILKEWNAEEGWIWDTSFSPDGQRLATVGVTGIVRLWDLQGQPLKRWEWKASQEPLRRVSFSPKDQLLATAGDDGIARLWNLQGQLLNKFNDPNFKIRYSSVSFSPDGETVATYGKNGTVAFWNLQGQMLTELKVSQDVLTSVSFSPDGHMLAVAGNSDTVHLWGLQNQPLTELKGHQGIVKSASFSPNGQQLITFGENSIVGLWDLQGHLLKELKENDHKIINVSFSPDGQQFVTTGDDSKARLWNFRGQLLKEFQGNNYKITSASFTRNAQQLATVEEDGTVRLWDSITGQPLIEFPQKQRDITSDSFSPDGQQLATIEDYDYVHLWDWQGQHVATVTVGHRGGVSSFGFSPDSKLLATAGNDGIVRLWKLQGQPLTEQLSYWQTTQGSIRKLEFSPDGQRLATAGDDGTVCLWDLQGQPLETWKVDQGLVSNISFSPDGQQLATAGSSGNVKWWRIETFDQLMRRGCDWVRDYLQNNPDVSDRHLCDDVN